VYEQNQYEGETEKSAPSALYQPQEPEPKGESSMIDTDKMRAAYAATPLCQKDWTKRDGSNPTMLCAISAMVSFAGVQPDLIHTMVNALGAHDWFYRFAVPVLQAEYGMPSSVAAHVPTLFDRQENEWRGVQAVLDLCDSINMQEMHTTAIQENAERFPQHTCEYRPTTLRPAAFSVGELKHMFLGNGFTIEANFYVEPVEPAPTLALTPPKPPKSKFWTASENIIVPKKYTGNLVVL
jgi:hypothetical protein